MSSRITAGTLIVFAIVLAACGDPEPEQEKLEPVASVVAPYPNDLLTVEDKSSTTGVRLNLSQSSTPLMEQALRFSLWKPPKLQGWLNGLDGFSTYGPMYFLVGRQVDPATLPADGKASTAAGASLFLVNLKKGSARNGKRIPVKVGYQKVKDDDLGTVHLLEASPRVPLEPGARHALVALRTIKDTGGGAMAATNHYQVLSGRRELTLKAAQYAAMTHARKRAKPLFDYLEKSGVSRDQVAEAFVFTTQTARTVLSDIRSYLRGSKAPPLNIKWLGAYAPDKLPNKPANVGDLTGVGVVLKGQFDMPDLRGADNDVPSPPGATKVLTVPFIIALPATPPKDPMRVVMLQHGHGGQKEYALYVAPHLAKYGIATVAIDHVGHGELKATGTFIEIIAIQRLRGNFVMTVSTGLRFIQALRTMTEVKADGKTYKLATTKPIGYIGESLGGISGGALAGVEPDVGVLVLNVAAGGLAASLIGKYLSIIGDDKTLLKLGIIASFQAMVDRVDPVNFATMYAGAGTQVMMQNVIGDSLGTETVYTLARAVGASLVCPCPKEIKMPELPRKTAPTTGPGLFYFSVGKHGCLLANNEVPAASKAMREQAAHFFKTYFEGGKGMIVEP